MKLLNSAPAHFPNSQMSFLPEMYISYVPKRFYDLFDRVEAHLPNYWPGTNWCNKCATIADKAFAEEKDYIPPANVSTMFRTMFPLVYISSHLKRYMKFFNKMDPRRLKTLHIDTYNFLLGNKNKDKMCGYRFISVSFISGFVSRIT